MTIEDCWSRLASSSTATQIRVDAQHPHDLYAAFDPPDRVGMMIVCKGRPDDLEPMRSIEVEDGLRADGRWTLRMSLMDPRLRPVFAALCDDIVHITREGVPEARLSQEVMGRIRHWRTLLSPDANGLPETVLRGLIGELLVLRDRLVPELGPLEAVRAWRGPSGAPQDFILADGRRLEVKTVRAHAQDVSINGLDQLDGLGDPLELVIVRTESSAPAGPRAMTAPGLVSQLRQLMGAVPQALSTFETALAVLRWHDHPSHLEVALRLVDVETFNVGDAFPRLTRRLVPTGILSADYRIALPRQPAEQPGATN